VFGRVRVRGPPPDIGGGFEGQQGDRDVRFDERIGAGIAQELDDRSISLKRDEPGRIGASDAGCEAGGAHGVFDANAALLHCLVCRPAEWPLG
jgi:hypothetical protein